MAEFRRFKPIKYSNVTVGGEYEYKIEPWVVIFMVGLKLQPTDYCMNSMKENEMRALLARDVLGKPTLSRAVEAIVPTGWRWDGMRYSFEHNPMQFGFGRQTEFQVEFWIEAPPEYAKNNDKKSMEIGFKTIAPKIATIKNFQSNKFFSFTSSSGVK